MTCYNCIHFDNCLDNGKTRYYGTNIACNDVEERCKFFKNKSNFIEIIKCRDCESFISRDGDSWCEEHSDGWGDHIVYVDEDDFCSFGARKTD